MKRALIATMATILLITISCTKKSSDPEQNQDTKTNPQKNETIGASESLVIQISNDQGQMIPDARLLLGDLNTAGTNWLAANENGQIAIPKAWTQNQDVTVDAPGYTRVTVKDQAPKAVNIVLRKKSLLPLLSLRGTVSGITTKDKDGYIDFGIVLDSMTRYDLLNFSVNKIVSPWTEKISAAGFDFPVPQNIYIPKQKESYFISVTIQKPWFNLNYDTYGNKSIYTIQGRFPMKKVISEVQNKKPYYELVNLFEFSSAGQLPYGFSSIIPSPIVESTQFKLDKAYTITAPKVAQGQVALGISAFKENFTFQPLDVKYMQSEQSTKFKSTATTTPYFIGVIKNSNEFEGDSATTERMSVSIDSPSAPMTYLPLMNQPTWVSTSNLQIDMPSILPTDYEDQGMVVVVSELQNLNLPDGKTAKYKIPVWEIHAPQWANYLAIPNIDTPSTTPKRVEVTLLAKKVDNSGQQNPVTIISTNEERVENSTHFTKSARDY